MRCSTTWVLLGTIWGGSVGLIFGPLPAFAIVFGILEDLISGSVSDRTVFGLMWGAVLLLSILLGASSGFLLGRATLRTDQSLKANTSENLFGPT
ncbi:MAG: hypothetical protein H0T47_17610 [Planctomycetaceae bacterium]|nr:hypothetical protein [Planctomycetaceae bacterium]